MSERVYPEARQRSCGPGVSIAWLWVLIAAIWSAALATSTTAARPTILPPDEAAHELTLWEQVARRYDDRRTDDQIRKDNSLVFAVWEKDAAKARRTLDTGADPNARYLDPCGHGSTPLMEATRQGDEALVTLLVNRGANPNLGVGGVTPLDAAVSGGHTEIARRLVAAGAHAKNP